jgi:hypothetical protein
MSYVGEIARVLGHKSEVTGRKYPGGQEYKTANQNHADYQAKDGS